MAEVAALPARFDAAPGARIGLVSLASDEVASDEIRAVAAQPGLAIHETRIANADTISAETLTAMADGLTEAAGRLPGAGSYDAVGYLCTSASMLIGDEGVADRVRAALPGAGVTNPMQAALAACRALGAARIALVAPYVADVTLGIARRFEAGGVSVPRVGSFLVDSDARVARISADALRRGAAGLASGGEVDAVFLSCTALRTVHRIAHLEHALGRPVISSTQAVAWDLLRRAGRGPAPGDWGRLLAV